MKLVIASNNKHKIKEIQAILGSKFDEIISQSQAGIDIEVVEDGITFEQNAIKKASEIAALLPDCAVLADDSGIEVDFLNGAPGVYSARYSGIGAAFEGATDDKNNQKLLDALKDIPKDKRGCRFTSCVALVRPNMPLISAFGHCLGIVGFELMGDGGFGYDPLFYIPELDKTYAQITPAEKNSISHRGRALANLFTMLEKEGK